MPTAAWWHWLVVVASLLGTVSPVDAKSRAHDGRGNTDTRALVASGLRASAGSSEMAKSNPAGGQRSLLSLRADSRRGMYSSLESELNGIKTRRAELDAAREKRRAELESTQLELPDQTNAWYRMQDEVARLEKDVEAYGRACTTMAECKKQVLDNFAGEFDGVVKQTQEKKKKKTLGSEQVAVAVEANAAERAQRRADSDFADMKLTPEEQQEVKRLAHSIIASHPRGKSHRDGMAVDLDASRQAHKQYAEMKEQRRSGHRLAEASRATTSHNQHGAGAGNVLCSGPRGCLGA